MIKEALEYLIGLGKQRLVEIDGRTYATGKLEGVKPPQPECMETRTLAGFVDAIRLDNECPPVAIRVASPVCVVAKGGFDAVWLTLTSVASCLPAAQPAHHFATWLPQEDFTIWLLSCFVDSHDRARVLQVVGNLRAEKLATLADDGITQVAQVRAGVRGGEVEIKNPVTLAPIRTFPEVEQPASQFILRLRDGREGQPPAAALFEVVDGKWQAEAMQSIRAELIKLLGPENKIPVLV